MPPKSMVSRTCEQCDVPFLAETRFVLKGNARYCSNSCANRAKWAKNRLHPSDRFMKFVQKGPNPSDCWLWTGGRTGDGYGAFGVSKGNKVGAHRYSYEIHTGPIPDGLQILHSCDQPLCVAPHHLHPGSNKQNMKEMVERGRSLKGVKSRNAKLTEQHVFEIKDLRSAGWTNKQIADIYGVSVSAVSFVFNGRTWKHVA